MYNVEELKAKIEQLDAERVRITTEIEKRKHDLKLHRNEMTANLIATENDKIKELADVLEDVEFDIGSCMDMLFKAAGDTVFKEAKETLLEYLEPAAETEEPDQKTKLIALREKGEHDLQQYKKKKAELEKELLELDDVIEATEAELDFIVSCLAGMENTKLS